MKLILENWQSFVNEQETIEEAERHTLSNKLGKLLAKGKPEDREKIIVDFFKILISGQGYEKLFPTWPEMSEDKKKAFIKAGKKFDINKGRAKEFAQQIIKATSPQDIEDNTQNLVDDVETQTGLDIDTQAQQGEDTSATPEQLDAATTKAAENAKKSENPDQQMNKDSETIANKMGNPEAAPKVKSAIEDKLEDSEEAQADQTNDPNIVDPNDETLQLIKATYTNFKDDFYDKSKTQGLKGQSELVKQFLAALEAFAKPEQAAALARASDSKPATGKRDDLAEMEVAPKNIKALKARIRNFQRALRASEQYIKIYQDKLKANKKMVQGDRDKLVGIAEKTQQTIMGLNKTINGILGIAKQQEEPQPLQEQTAGQKYMSMLEEIEEVYEKLTQGKMLQIMSNLDNDTQMQWAEVKPIIQNALEELNKIKKYFPQIVPFEGSEVESAEMLKRYKEAIKQIDLDASDIQTLPDEITDEDGSAILINFQSKLIGLSEELQKIFGVAGLKSEKDSAKARNVVPDDAGDAPTTDQDSSPEQIIQDLAVELEDPAEEAIQQALKELGDGAEPEQIAAKAEEILRTNKKAAEALKAWDQTLAQARADIDAQKKAELAEKAKEMAIAKAAEELKTAGKAGEERFAKELNVLGIEDPDERSAVTKFLGLLLGEGTISEEQDGLDALTKATTGVLKKETLERILAKLSIKDKELIKKVITRDSDGFIKMIRMAKKNFKDPEKKTLIPFKTITEINKFFDRFMFKDMTIKNKIKAVGITLDNPNKPDPNFANFKKFLSYFIAHETIAPQPNLKEEEDKKEKEKAAHATLVKMSSLLGGERAEAIVAQIRLRDESLYKWATGFIKPTNEFKILMYSVDEYLDRKSFEFGTKGLIAPKLAGFDFTPATQADLERVDADVPGRDRFDETIQRLTKILEPFIKQQLRGE